LIFFLAFSPKNEGTGKDNLANSFIFLAQVNTLLFLVRLPYFTYAYSGC